jgi:rod shape-determining protein MreC
MKQIFRSRSDMILLGLAFFLHLLLLSVQAAKSPSIPLLRGLLMDFSSVFLRASDGTVQQMKNIWYNYVDLRQARQENHWLKARIGEYEKQLTLSREKLKESGRLTMLEELDKALNLSSVKARIIGADTSQWYGSRLLNRGKNAGVSLDCAVLSPEGILGRIVQVSSTASIMQLVTDVESGAGVILEGSRAQGALMGEGDNSASIDYIRSSETVKVGERVLTSGLDQIYPKGLLVGTVSQVTPTRQIYQSIRVIMAARPEHTEEVLILLKNHEK